MYKKHSYFVAILDAVYQSAVYYFIPYFAYIDSDVGIWEFGVACNVASVWGSLLHLCLVAKSWVCSLMLYCEFIRSHGELYALDLVEVAGLALECMGTLYVTLPCHRCTESISNFTQT